VWNGAEMVDATQEACLDICPHDDIDVVPTTTAVDATPSARPWLESIAGQSNLPDGVTLAEALGCFLPQGIAGCGFEQHLESAYKSVNRSHDPEETSYGFLRDGALLAVVFVSDEADCSHNAEWNTIFQPTENGGNEVFWSDPDNQNSPTSALCWNAGVTCTGAGTPFDECHAQDKDLNATEIYGAVEPDAVLFPLSRYVEELSVRPTYLAEIAGVPAGYAEGLGSMEYSLGTDTQHQIDYGIGPACESTAGSAVPSVRVRELVEQVDAGERNSFSICAPDLSPAFEVIAQRIVARLP
jgi:hypothetical protein